MRILAFYMFNCSILKLYKSSVDYIEDCYQENLKDSEMSEDIEDDETTISTKFDKIKTSAHEILELINTSTKDCEVRLNRNKIDYDSMNIESSQLKGLNTTDSTIKNDQTGDKDDLTIIDLSGMEKLNRNDQTKIDTYENIKKYLGESIDHQNPDYNFEDIITSDNNDIDKNISEGENSQTNLNVAKYSILYNKILEEYKIKEDKYINYLFSDEVNKKKFWKEQNQKIIHYSREEKHRIFFKLTESDINNFLNSLYNGKEIFKINISSNTTVFDNFYKKFIIKSLRLFYFYEMRLIETKRYFFNDLFKRLYDDILVIRKKIQSTIDFNRVIRRKLIGQDEKIFQIRSYYIQKEDLNEILKEIFEYLFSGENSCSLHFLVNQNHKNLKRIYENNILNLEKDIKILMRQENELDLIILNQKIYEICCSTYKYSLRVMLIIYGSHICNNINKMKRNEELLKDMRENKLYSESMSNENKLRCKELKYIAFKDCLSFLEYCFMIFVVENSIGQHQFYTTESSDVF